MFLKRPDLTAGSRPTLAQDESLLVVQDNVGLYEGKYKIASCQKGHAYLTSHRACYVDDSDPRANSWAIDLKDVERHEFQAGFLKSSAKITLYPKPLRRGFRSLSKPGVPQSPQFQKVVSASSPASRSSSPFRPSAVAAPTPPVVIGTWVCPICSFSNPVPSNFDPTIATEAFPLPPCLACGIKPPFALVLKAAIAANAKHGPEDQGPSSKARGSDAPSTVEQGSTNDDGDSSQEITCPRCTFHNHPGMRICELCSAPLPVPSFVQRMAFEDAGTRSASPGPEISGLTLEEEHEPLSVKFSFRNGGDRVFYERLKNAIIQRKWLLQNAPPIPRTDNDRSPTPGASDSPGRVTAPRAAAVGIAGLEQRGLQTRKQNEAVLGGAFEDLEALMASAKDIVALAERFAEDSGSAASDPLLSQSAAALGMVTTKDILGDSSNTLYISELARNLAEYVTDDRRGILRSQGGTMSLVDLWYMFNRSQNGVELVSPADFVKAAEAWDKLGLPVKLRKFKSGLLAVQRRDASDEKTIKQLSDWLHSSRKLQPEQPPPWDWAYYGFGVTAQQAAARFGWSLGVATEELEMAEERGALCREEGIEGLKFWLNFLTEDEEQVYVYIQP
ncbi:EAP30/Vps36 family-domain-containing protein [Exophiala viscosa]|uniref:EAP30/Vps36 family-domain-containing protein n=1 Tax=Exophiala viscosa TaxID=2486360 RepID=UPI00218FA089|nr:EAP30/Vps36 family-domain-containing protein [Exophiala viscosa]